MYLSLLILSQTSSDPTATVFAQYGVIGVALLVLGRFALSAVKREQDRADRLDLELAKLHEAYRSESGPALAAAASAVSSALEVIEEIRRDDYRPPRPAPRPRKKAT